jgi:hypothetical protein
MGTNWLCLSQATYESEVPSEVLSYYNQEAATWAELAAYLVSQKLARYPRGPVTIENVACYFVNIEVDHTSVMSQAIQALEAVTPYGYQHTTKQMEVLFGQQYYTGSLSAVNAYNNAVNAHEAAKNPTNGFNFGALSWASAIENASDPTQYAILKHPEVDKGGIALTLIEGELPQGWLPEPELP